jgi:hypothetical protein
MTAGVAVSEFQHKLDEISQRIDAFLSREVRHRNDSESTVRREGNIVTFGKEGTAEPLEEGRASEGSSV